MSCFSPVKGFESMFLTVNGKRSFVYDVSRARVVCGKPVEMVIPCRKCEGCRFSYTRSWAVRISHEAYMYEQRGLQSSFITLTYNNDFIPPFGSLDYKGHWTSFLKRFRKAISPLTVRFYMIGEYGSLNLRPHYHAIIFGYGFPDKKIYQTRNGIDLYRSPFLESLWTVPRGQEFAGMSYGFSSVGSVTYASAAYVAGYSQKKLIGVEYDGIEEGVSYDGEIFERPRVNPRYVRYNCVTGDFVEVAPERALMSNRDGIGKSWFNAYGITDIYSLDVNNGQWKDSLHLRGRYFRPPSYYDKLFMDLDPESYENIKKSRQDSILASAEEFTPERLAQRRECLKAKLSMTKRKLSEIYK